MSAVVSAPKPVKKAAHLPAQEGRTARFRSKAFARELTTAFHAAKLRALDAAKPKV